MEEVERRTFRRLPAKADVRVSLLDSERSNPAQSRNIAGGGILFSTNKAMNLGALVDIEVIHPPLPSGKRHLKPLRARIRVVRVKGTAAPYEVAGEFVD